VSLSAKTLKDLYFANIDKVYKYFFFRVLNREISEDLTSETFLIFAQHIERKDILNLQGYLMGIVKNVFNGYLRKKYLNKEESCSSYELDSNMHAEFDDKSYDYVQILKKLLPYLPYKQRVIMRLRFVEGLKIEEIAHKMKKDRNYVSTTQKRAFKSLKRLMNVQRV